MEKEENKNDTNKKNTSETPVSSLKSCKFNGLTSDQIIKKYKDVLKLRENQFNELKNIVTNNYDKIHNLEKHREKSVFNNEQLKIILSKKETLFKQELSNKEIIFMKLSHLEKEYDDLQNKIDDIINKQNALADANLQNNQINNDEEVNVIKNEVNNLNNENNKEEIKKDIKEDNKENKKEENKEEIKYDNRENKKEVKSKEETEEENKGVNKDGISSARERLNKIRNKNEKVKKLNLADFVNQNNEEKKADS